MSPLMQMNARIALVFFIILGLFLYDPILITIALTVFTTAYVILFKSVRTRLEKNSKVMSDIFTERFKLLNDGFGGIKDILLIGRSSNFKKNFHKTSNKLAYSEGTIEGVARVPRYLMELLSFGAMIALVLYLIKTTQGDLLSLIHI